MASHSTVDTLVKMANQIGDFFNAQRGDQVAGVAEHITKFWDPRMRAGIIDYVRQGGEGLSPLALEAVKRIAEGAKHTNTDHGHHQHGENADG
ncbi:MAG TPA: formate dehydrogenase subunit delta [Methylocystis sp.]|nr:formate dehydrogenase subunit delta [Methylocystis sp.]